MCIFYVSNIDLYILSGKARYTWMTKVSFWAFVNSFFRVKVVLLSNYFHLFDLLVE